MADTPSSENPEQTEQGRESSPASGRLNVGDKYERRAHLYSTRTAECFEAIEKASGENVHLWLLRFPLSVHAEDAARFVRRLKRISELENLAIPPFQGFGVDGSGAAYLVTDAINGRRVIDSSDNIGELQMRFLDVLRAVAALHADGMFLGDLSEDSFLVDQGGRVILAGLLGTFDAGARQTAMLPPADTYHYLAPEQRSGNSPDIVSDVYALGVYGYRLFTGRYLLEEKPVAGSVENPTGSAPPPTVVRPELAKWVDDVLGKCLETSPDQRYRDAGEILQVVEEALRSGTAPGGTGAWSRRSVAVRPTNLRQETPVGAEAAAAAARAKSAAHKPTEAQIKSPVKKRSMLILIWGLAVALGAGISAFIFFSLDSIDVGETPPSAEPAATAAPVLPQGSVLKEAEQPAGGGDPIALASEYAPPELKPLIAKLGAVAVPITERQSALAEIAQSDDPIAYGVLIATAKSKVDPALRQSAQQLLVERIKKVGLKRSATIIEKWFKDERQAQRDPAASPVYGLILTACDPARSFESRKTAMQQAYTSAQGVSLQLTAALAIDESEEKFVPLLRKFLSGEVPEQDVASVGLGALLFMHPLLSVFLDTDLAATIRKFSDTDLRWTLLHSENIEGNVRDELVNETIMRKLPTPFQSVFLEAYAKTRGTEVSADVDQGLIKASLGEISEEQVDALARWTSPFADQALLAVCATAKDVSVAQDAFDILAGRSLRMQPAESLIQWIKTKFWDYRKRAVKAIGILSLIDRASPEDIDTAFNALMPFSAGGLFRVMTGTKNKILIKQAVDRLGAITPSGELMPLLANEDKDIRIAAVEALKGRNELVVLQGILRAFEKEKDPEVREVYRKVHWVTRERGSSLHN